MPSDKRLRAARELASALEEFEGRRSALIHVSHLPSSDPNATEEMFVAAADEMTEAHERLMLAATQYQQISIIEDH